MNHLVHPTVSLCAFLIGNALTDCYTVMEFHIVMMGLMNRIAMVQVHCIALFHHICSMARHVITVCSMVSGYCNALTVTYVQCAASGILLRVTGIENKIIYFG